MHKVLRVLKDHKAHKVLLDRKELLVHRVHKALLVLKEQLGLLDLLVLQALKVLKA